MVDDLLESGSESPVDRYPTTDRGSHGLLLRCTERAVNPHFRLPPVFLRVLRFFVFLVSAVSPFIVGCVSRRHVHREVNAVRVSIVLIAMFIAQSRRACPTKC